MGRAQLVFTFLAVFIVLSMIMGTVAFAVIQATSNDTSESGNTGDADEQSDLVAQARKDAEARPNDPQSLANLANLLANNGKAEESIVWYERALALTPDDASLRFDFAQTLVQAGKPNDAELQFQKAIELEPNNPYAHYYLAELYRAWDPPRTEDAIAEYQLVIAAGPDTYVADESRDQLTAYGVGTPQAATPASPVGEQGS